MVLSNKSLKSGVLWVRFWTYLSYLSLYSHPTKNWCFWTVVLEKILESPLDCKEIKPVHLEISPEYSLKGLMLKLKLQYFGHLMRRAGSLKKTLMLGKIEGRRRRGATEDEMVGWHHQHNGHEFQQALGVGDGQGGLACCSPWVARSWTWLSDWTELNWGDFIQFYCFKWLLSDDTNLYFKPPTWPICLTTSSKSLHRCLNFPSKSPLAQFFLC